MDLRIVPPAMLGNLLPGKWKVALVRGEQLEMFLPGAGQPALLAPLQRVEAELASLEGGGRIETAIPSRIESRHYNAGIALEFEFVVKSDLIGFPAILRVTTYWSPATEKDLH